jgi:hypothetical protein
MGRLFLFLVASAAIGPASSAFAQEVSGSFGLDLGAGSAHADLDVSLGAEAAESESEGRADGYSPSHPFALGLRSAVWIQRSLEPGVGGHLRWRPISWLGLEVSTDHFFAVSKPARQSPAQPDQPEPRRDHMVGGDAFLAVIGDEEFFIAPTAGVSLDVRVTEPKGAGEDATVQPLAGGHAGLMGELYLIDGLAAFAAAKAGVLVGAAADVVLSEDAHVSGKVFVEPVGFVTLGASYYF